MSESETDAAKLLALVRRAADLRERAVGTVITSPDIPAGHYMSALVDLGPHLVTIADALAKDELLCSSCDEPLKRRCPNGHITAGYTRTP